MAGIEPAALRCNKCIKIPLETSIYKYLQLLAISSEMPKNLDIYKALYQVSMYNYGSYIKEVLLSSIKTLLHIWKCSLTLILFPAWFFKKYDSKVEENVPKYFGRFRNDLSKFGIGCLIWGTFSSRCL
jgi:hypothetical protein